MAVLLYGAGLRLLECARLRVKDVDLAANQIVVRSGKGDRDRVTLLPAVVRPALERHLARVRAQHERDLRAGAGWVELPHALARKYPNAGRALLKTPGLGPAIQKAFSGILGTINDASQWSVRPQAILEEYRRFGHGDIATISDVYDLDLSAVDRAIGWLDTKYEGIALVEGAAAGGSSVLTPAAALAVIPADVGALLALNLRAVGEYATYCGFDVSLPHERLFALNVLALASSPSDSSKQIALAQLVRIARDVALRKSWQNLEAHAAVQAAQKIAQALSIRLTKAKLAQVVPVAGVVIGGGFNAYYTDKVCKAAFYLYRERFLAEKYGADEIEVTVEPAPTLDPEYETEP